MQLYHEMKYLRMRANKFYWDDNEDIQIKWDEFYEQAENTQFTNMHIDTLNTSVGNKLNERMP